MSSIANDIIAAKKKLAELLREKYTVDYFQREYKWEKKHIEQLLVDLEAAFLSDYEIGHTVANVSDYNCYYLGPIVICKVGRTRSIVDGQQRLTSITLLLIYLNNLQKELVEQEDIESLIFSRKGGATSYNIEVPQRQIILDALFKSGDYDIDAEDDFSVRNMYDRYTDIVTLFSQELKENKLPLFIEWLKENVVLVEIMAFSNENAYTIFETMNDRGLNLTPTEMLKGYILTNIGDADRIDEVNELWKKQISNLHRYSLQEDQEFIKAWLRGAYAETIRSSVKGAENEDFEKIGTRFHTWVKDNYKKIGLKNQDSFYYFIKGDFDFYANLYLRIINAETSLVVGLDIVYLSANWMIADSLAYPLLLAPINKLDDEETIIEKIRVVYQFLDIYTISRILSGKSVSQTAQRYTIYTLVRDLRNRNLDELKSILLGKLSDPSDSIDNFSSYQYQYDSRKFIHYLFARMAYFVSNHYHEKDFDFDDLLPSRKKNRLVLIPIIEADFDKYEDYFDDEDDFYSSIKMLGNFVLLPNSIAQVFNEYDFEKKLNLLRDPLIIYKAVIISDNAKIPDITSFINIYPLENLSSLSIKKRTEQLTELAKIVWNSDLL